MNIRVMVYKTDGSVEEKEIEHSLENLQAIVGGYIDFVGFPNNIDMILADEGKMNGKPINRMISFETSIYDFIAGDVIFASHDGEGETIGLSDEQVDYIKRYIARDRYVFNQTPAKKLYN